jgi:hypothetical protein
MIIVLLMKRRDLEVLGNTGCNLHADLVNQRQWANRESI